VNNFEIIVHFQNHEAENNVMEGGDSSLLYIIYQTENIPGKNISSQFADKLDSYLKNKLWPKFYVVIHWEKFVSIFKIHVMFNKITLFQSEHIRLLSR